MVGKTLSHYKILEELGRGGMGIVYKGEDTKLHRTVAIKVLPAAALSSDDDRARFYREARAAASLSHPNIATVYEIDEAVPEGSKDDDLLPFIAMEFIEGDTLEDRIKQGPMKLTEAVRIASEMAEGLKAAHAKDIVHRDIKAANVMLDGEGRAKILDFGLAQTAQSTKLTRMGSTLGTIAYMSPEQARSEEVDNRTDLWALGVVLYEMIAGKHPFAGDYEQAVVYSILNADPILLTDLRPSVPLELERIVLKCLNKDKKRRYQHSDDVIADLGGVDVKTPTVSLRRVIATRKSNTGKMSWPGYSAAVLVGALLGVGMMIIWGDDSDTSTFLSVTKISRLSVDADRQYHPEIHPDGRMVVYSSGATFSQQKLFTRSISGSSANRVTRSFDASENKPSISPDGSLISFLSQGSLYVVDYPAGVPAPLILSTTHSGAISSSAWNPDGTKIAFTSSSDSVFVFDLNTREKSFISALHNSHSITWSPSGELLAIVSGNPNSDELNVAPSQIFVINTSDGRVTPLTSSEHEDASPVWGKESRTVYFISDQGGGHDIYEQRLSPSNSPDGVPVRITVGLSLRSIDLANNETYFVGSEISYSQNIWVSEIDSGTVVSAKDAEALTSGSQVIEGLVVSHSGEWLAYDSDARGNQNIFVIPAVGGDALQITNHPSPEFVFSWSPDDQEIAFHTYRQGSRDAYTVSLGDLSITPLATDSVEERYPYWSADQSSIGVSVEVGDSIRFIEYNRHADGTWIMNDPLIDGAVSVGSKFSPVADLILYTSHEGPLRILDQNAGEARVLVDASFPPEVIINIAGAVWSLDGQTVFFKGVDNEGDGGIWSVPVGGGTPKQVLTLDGRTWGTLISAGNNRLYYTLREVSSNLQLLELEEVD